MCKETVVHQVQRSGRARIQLGGITGALLAAFCLGGLLLTVLTHTTSAQTATMPGDVTQLKINEFMTVNGGSVIDPADPEPQDGNDDWVEIYNPTAGPVDLQGLYLTDNLENLTKFQIMESLIIAPQGYFIFWADDDEEQGPTHLSFGLSGNGEALALVAADGTTVIDSYVFGEQETDVSEGRYPDGSSTWVKFTVATPGRSNQFVPHVREVQHEPLAPQAGDSVRVSAVITDDGAVAAATLFYNTGASGWMPIVMDALAENRYTAQVPGQPDGTLVSYYITAEGSDGETVNYPISAPDQNRKFLVGYDPPPLRINEIMADNGSTLPDPDEAGEFPDWFELYNAGNTALSLDGFFLTDDVNNATQFAIPSGLTIQPGGFMVFYADDDTEQGPQHTNFRLRDRGETVALFGPFGAAPIDIVEFDNQDLDQVYGRYPDGVDAWDASICPTPGRANELCKFLYMPTVLNSAAAEE